MTRIYLTAILLLCSHVLFSQQTLKITHLTGDFYIFTTYQSYKGTLFPANGMYFLTEAGAVMIDTPWDTSQFQPLLDSIRVRHNKEVVLCIATHSHEDRTGGLEFLNERGVRTYTSKRTDEICKETNKKRAQYHFENDTIFTVGQYSFEAFYPGEGHTPDNIVLWVPQVRLLYGGCFVKSTEATDLGNLADANVKAWPESIRKIQTKIGKPAYIIPGHQDWQSSEALDHTLRLLEGKK